MVWYSRMVRTGNPVRCANSSMLHSSTVSEAGSIGTDDISETLPPFTVTVNAVTIGRSDVLAVVERAQVGSVAGVPVPLSGGFWAQMWRVPVRSRNDDVVDVVVRLAPN